jgi:hypothetical protein
VSSSSDGISGSSGDSDSDYGSSRRKKKGLSSGGIAGVVVAAVALAGSVIAAIVTVAKKRKRYAQRKQDDAAMAQAPMSGAGSGAVGYEAGIQQGIFTTTTPPQTGGFISPQPGYPNGSITSSPAVTPGFEYRSSDLGLLANSPGPGVNGSGRPQDK